MWIKLSQRDAVIKTIDDNVLFEGRFSLVDEGDNGGVIVVFDGKHDEKLSGAVPFTQSALARRIVSGYCRAVQPVTETDMRLWPFAMILGLAACDPVIVDTNQTGAVLQPAESDVQLSRRQALNNFKIVASRVEPVAEQFCRQRSSQQNCDFRIVIDSRANQPPNAYQTEGANGRPIIAFTVSLITATRNPDEIAFVMAHEAAHHIEGHIAQQRQNAAFGATLFGALAGSLGTATSETIGQAQRLGAAVGVRRYSKGFELEADALGTVITDAAGYSPLRGAEFFFRIPDPGDRFLGTHPANADRLRTVQRVAASL